VILGTLTAVLKYVQLPLCLLALHINNTMYVLYFNTLYVPRTYMHWGPRAPGAQRVPLVLLELKLVIAWQGHGTHPFARMCAL
jgi:hypothetical protein